MYVNVTVYRSMNLVMHHYSRSILLQGVDESHQTTSTITPSHRLAVTVNVYGVCRSMVSFKVCIVLKGHSR